jgi:hypothetical protein
MSEHSRPICPVTFWTKEIFKMFTEVARDNMSAVCLSVTVKFTDDDEYHPNEILELITMRQNSKYICM